MAIRKSEQILTLGEIHYCWRMEVMFEGESSNWSLRLHYMDKLVNEATGEVVSEKPAPVVSYPFAEAEQRWPTLTEQLLTAIDELNKERLSSEVIEHKPIENWAGLEQDIRATPLFYRLYASSKDHPELGTIYTLIQDTVTSTHNVNDLGFALADLQSTIVPALSVYELENFNEMLTRNRIPLQVSVPGDAPPEFTPPPDWRHLELALRNTALFYRVYTTAKTILPLNTIFTLLQDTITSSHKLEDLNFVLSDLQTTIQPPLTVEEIAETNEILAFNNFPIVLT